MRCYAAIIGAPVASGEAPAACALIRTGFRSARRPAPAKLPPYVGGAHREAGYGVHYGPRERLSRLDRLRQDHLWLRRLRRGYVGVDAKLVSGNLVCPAWLISSQHTVCRREP